MILVTLVPTANGGRMSPAGSGYRPQVALFNNYQTSTTLEFVGADLVAPGNSVQVVGWFCTPNVYPRCIWPGRVLQVWEGPRHVGSLTINVVLNEAMLGVAADVPAEWDESMVTAGN